MQFTFLEELKILCGYKDRRGVEKWLAEMDVRLYRIGRRYGVDHEALEIALDRKYRVIKKQAEYQP